MTTRQSIRALKTALRPRLERHGFSLERRDGIRAHRSRGEYEDVVAVVVLWRLPRAIEVVVSVRSKALNEFLVSLGPGWRLDNISSGLDLRTFAPGADPFTRSYRDRRWFFTGDAPAPDLLDDVGNVLEDACRVLASISDPDGLATLLCEHTGYDGIRLALPTIGALALAGRHAEARALGAAATESLEVAEAANIQYLSPPPESFCRLMEYCDRLA